MLVSHSLQNPIMKNHPCPAVPLFQVPFYLISVYFYPTVEHSIMLSQYERNLWDDRTRAADRVGRVTSTMAMRGSLLTFVAAPPRHRGFQAVT